MNVPFRLRAPNNVAFHFPLFFTISLFVLVGNFQNCYAMSFVTMNDGGKIPVVGYGTTQAPDAELEKALDAALEAGYRYIDTAHDYQNEKAIGRVLKRWISSNKLKREDLFVVTKLPPVGNHPEGVRKYIRRSLEYLQLDYIDLYLIHVPFAFKDIDGNLLPVKPDGKFDIETNTDHIAIWQAMEEQVDKGLARSIGLANFNQTQIQRILNNSRRKPSNLQTELHVYNQQIDTVDFCKKNNIVVTAYSPLGSGKFSAQFGQTIELPDILGNVTLKTIAEKHNKTAAQVLLRYSIQRGIVVIPRSANPEHIKENIDVFDFKLDDRDMDQLRSLDKKARITVFKEVFPGVEEHPEYPIGI